MNYQRLIRQLRREAVGNPKKAAILGLLALVALWFWAPLVWGWVAPKKKATASSATKTVAVATPESQASTHREYSDTEESAQQALPAWHEIAKWRKNDPRSLAATWTATQRDPFTPVENKSAENLDNLDNDLTPERLGMVLSSTIVGPQHRVAVINGETYSPGATVTVTSSGKTIQFVLAEIHPRRIVLMRGGQRFELHSGTVNQRIQMFSAAN